MDTVGVYVLATLLVCLSPGPNVFLILSLGLRHGAGAALRAVLGVSSATCVYLAAAAAGLLALLAASERVFAIVRWIGATYLVYTGIRLLIAATRVRELSRLESNLPAAQPGLPFWQGFITQLANPKALLFWTSLLPQFIDPSDSLARQVILLGAIGIAIDIAVLSAYGLVAAAVGVRAIAGSFGRVVDIGAGAFFTAAGLYLALAGGSAPRR